MLDIRRIREKPDEMRKGLKSRGEDTGVVDEILSIDARKRALLTETESLKSERNSASKEIGALKKRGEDTAAAQKSVRSLGGKISALDAEIRELSSTLETRLMNVPNVPHETVPAGPDESGNRVVREHGERREFDFEPLKHVELGSGLGIMDLERGAKIAGSGFPLLMERGALLERALIQYMLDIHVKEHGYTEIWPPVMCSSASMTGTGQLPRLADDMYKVESDDLYMAPTAEVPVTNFFAGEIIERPLPVYFTAYTCCFRREAGAAGKQTRGLIRVHQFDKVEMVKFVEPETSYEELETLLADAEDIIRRLKLPYRVLQLCTGDMSFASAKCYDIELWAPGQNEWLEVSSCSNFEDFQARRAGIKYRDESGKPRFVHTLNGSGVALARLVVAILENYQQADGTVVIPDVLVPYMDGLGKLVKRT
ncbi:MAG: serine--tRNA ligase [Kiritimatiellia bacterium]